MISVDEAALRIAGAVRPLPAENVPIAAAAGRVLAEDACATFDQPPAPMSAMDGYAVHASDARAGAELLVIGDAPAGRLFAGRVGVGEAVRIFTGGVVPDGADAVVIQEDTVFPPSPSGGEGRGEGDVRKIRIKEAAVLGDNVRARGLDFRTGDMLIEAGRRLTPRDVALLAGANFAQARVTRKPRVGIVATGDELCRPGEPRKDGGVIASSTYALQSMVRAWGGEALDLGILPDRPEAYAQLPQAANGVDLIVTQGGASVGDHDLVRSALKPLGFVLDFWKIAMRPGKPLIFGRLNDTPLIGLPGNPVSAMVCAVLFLAPAIAAMLGTEYCAPIVSARLLTPLKANGRRQDYLRARLIKRDGALFAEPFELQDSSMQRVFARADGLIVRPVNASPAAAGDTVEMLLLDGC